MKILLVGALAHPLWRRVGVAVIGTAISGILLGCQGGDNARGREETVETAGEVCLPPIPADSVAARAVSDGNWRFLANGIVVSGVVGSPGKWLVDYPWFWVPSKSRELFDRVQMDSLEALGLVDSTTAVNVLSYRMLFAVGTFDSLRVLVKENRPHTPPIDILEAQNEVESGGRSLPP